MKTQKHSHQVNQFGFANSCGLYRTYNVLRGFSGENCTKGQRKREGKLNKYTKIFHSLERKKK